MDAFDALKRVRDFCVTQHYCDECPYILNGECIFQKGITPEEMPIEEMEGED